MLQLYPRKASARLEERRDHASSPVVALEESDDPWMESYLAILPLGCPISTPFARSDSSLRAWRTGIACSDALQGHLRVVWSFSCLSNVVFPPPQVHHQPSLLFLPLETPLGIPRRHTPQFPSCEPKSLGVKGEFRTERAEEQDRLQSSRVSLPTPTISRCAETHVETADTRASQKCFERRGNPRWKTGA